MNNTNEQLYKNTIANNMFFVSKLDELGIDNHYTGYFYLIDIFDITINGERSVKSYSREIFPIVAKNFNKTTCTVERNIRVLIHSCWNEEMCKKLKCFYNPRVMPTCCQFISMIETYILSFLL